MPLFRTLRFKIILAYSVIIISFALLLLYNNSYSKDVIRNQLIESTLYTQQLYISKLDASLDDLRNYLITTLNQNSDMSDFNINSSIEPDYFPKIQKIQLRLDRDRAIYNIADMLFYCSPLNDKLILSKGSELYSSEASERIMEIISSNKSAINNTLDSWQLLKISDLNGFVRIISDGTGNFIGAWVSAEKLFGFEKNKNINANTLTVVLSPKGDVLLSSSSPGEVSELLKANISKLTEKYLSIYNPYNGNKYLITAFRPKKANVLYTLILRENDVFDKLSYFRTMVIFVPTLVTIAFILFLLYLRKLLFKPIDEIIKGMKKVSSGDLTICLQEKGLTELRFLISSFNDMVEQINKLKVDVFDEQLRFKEAQLEAQKAELKYLQLQINPHFLANSLCITYNLTFLNDLETIRKLTLHMAQYFRYSMKIKTPLVELMQESKFIEDYLAIQKIRFTRRLSYTIDIPEQFNLCLLPPMTLQPFVENCIIHSMVALDKPITITVYASNDPQTDPEYFSIYIEDNGVGFSLESLEMFNNPTFLLHNSDIHTGVWNVFYRLRLNFGPNVKLEFSNLTLEGSRVRISIPMTQIKFEKNGEKF